MENPLLHHFFFFLMQRAAETELLTKFPYSGELSHFHIDGCYILRLIYIYMCVCVCVCVCVCFSWNSFQTYLNFWTDIGHLYLPVIV